MYRFKSQATGDLLMLDPQGDQLLLLLGREPARQGIIETADMTRAISQLQAAAQADDAARAAASANAAERPGDEGSSSITLRQRVWPFVEMLRSAQAADKPIVWGI